MQHRDLPTPAFWERCRRTVERTESRRRRGRVVRGIGLGLEASGLATAVGELCRLRRLDGSELLAETVGFREERAILMPLGDLAGVGPDCPVERVGKPFTVAVGPDLSGRVLDGLGRPLDGKGPVRAQAFYPVWEHPPAPLERPRITRPLFLGIRAIDGLLTCGRGQRVGIFSGSGVGKSTLLGMVARYTEADRIVIGMVGERGREVRGFLEQDLGEGLARSVVVVATSDQPPMVRIKGALVATAIAEYFRDQGENVLLLMDSLTRFAMAQREVALAAGEPPATRGYPPSVFGLLPRLLERAGTSAKGSITGFYTVLVEGDDLLEPITDTARGILDGQIVLSRNLAAEGLYPAIDILESISRLMPEIVSAGQWSLTQKVREVLITYREAEDLLHVGAYVPGTSPRIDYACAKITMVKEYLRQDRGKRTGGGEAKEELEAIFATGGAAG